MFQIPALSNRSLLHAGLSLSTLRLDRRAFSAAGSSTSRTSTGSNICTTLGQCTNRQGPRRIIRNPCFLARRYTVEICVRFPDRGDGKRAAASASETHSATFICSVVLFVAACCMDSLSQTSEANPKAVVLAISPDLSGYFAGRRDRGLRCVRSQAVAEVGADKNVLAGQVGESGAEVR